MTVTADFRKRRHYRFRKTDRQPATTCVQVSSPILFIAPPNPKSRRRDLHYASGTDTYFFHGASAGRHGSRFTAITYHSARQRPALRFWRSEAGDEEAWRCSAKSNAGRLNHAAVSGQPRCFRHTRYPNSLYAATGNLPSKARTTTHSACARPVVGTIFSIGSACVEPKTPMVGTAPAAEIIAHTCYASKRRCGRRAIGGGTALEVNALDLCIIRRRGGVDASARSCCPGQRLCPN